MNYVIWMMIGLIILWAIGQAVEAWFQYICRMQSEQLFEFLQSTANNRTINLQTDLTSNPEPKKSLLSTLV